MLSIVSSVSFVVLCVGSALTLVQTLMRKQPAILTENSWKSRMVWGIALIALAYVLVATSALSIKYWLLAYLLISLLIDFVHMRKHRYELTPPISQRRFVWQILDNSAWVAIILALFFA